MNHSLQPMSFDNGEFHLDIDEHDIDGFHVPAEQLARALSTRGRNLVRSIPDSEKGRSLVSGPGGEQDSWYLTEAGFYRAIGQRQAGRITDPTVRATVERFQSWVYHVVLPSIRKTGRYSAVDPAFPITWTWDEVAAEIRQRYGYRLTEVDITRGLRAAGVLKLSRSGPRIEYAAWFWFTGSAWTVHPHILPELVQKLIDTRRALGDMQAQLQLDVATTRSELPAPQSPSGEGSPARRAAVDDRGERGPANDPSTS